MNGIVELSPRTFTLSAVGLTALALLGTSVPVVREPETAIVRPLFAPSDSSSSTGSGLFTSTLEPSSPALPTSSNADLIAELRVSTSFTWEQTAKLFGVSRRTVHLWAAGGNMASQNEEHLAELLREVRAIRAPGAPDQRLQLLAILDRERQAHSSTDNDISRPAATYVASA